MNRLQTLDQVQQYVGDYFSKDWIMKNVLHFDDDDVTQMKDQIGKEVQSGEIQSEDEEQPEAEQPPGIQPNGVNNE